MPTLPHVRRIAERPRLPRQILTFPFVNLGPTNKRVDQQSWARIGLRRFSTNKHGRTNG